MTGAGRVRKANRRFPRVLTAALGAFAVALSAAEENFDPCAATEENPDPCGLAERRAEENLAIDLSRTPLPMITFENLPKRAGPLIELGRGINETGPLAPGIELPTGAVWQPALWIYGSQRTAFLANDGDRRTRPGGDYSELAARMDLFANLELSGTERVLAHIRPMDERGQFAGRRFIPGASGSKWDLDWDGDFETLFFDGDLGELFPMLDPDDRRSGDIGIAAGKFPVEFQNGYMVRDEMTAIGLAQANLQMQGSSGIRLAFLWGFDGVNRPDSAPEREDVDLFGLFAEGNFPWGLLELDVAGTFSDAARGDQINVGIGWNGHTGRNNYSLYANMSRHSNQEIDAARGLNTRPNGQEIDYDGTLVVASYSRDMNLNRELLYVTGYWADGDFGRLASNATPVLGPVGLSFAGVGLGGYRPALWPRSLDSAGGAVGWQRFFNDDRSNWVLEAAFRHDLAKDDPFGDTSGYAVTTRFQRKILNTMTLQIDAYHAILADDARAPQDAETDNDSSAVRVELAVNF